MAVTYLSDATSFTDAVNTNTTSVTGWTAHADADCLVVVTIVFDATSADRPISGVTTNGGNAWEKAASINSSAGDEYSVEVWFTTDSSNLTAHKAGAVAVDVTATGTCTDLCASALSLSGVDSGGEYGASDNVDTASCGASATVSVGSLATGALMIGGMAYEEGAVTDFAVSTGTELQEVDMGQDVGGSAYNAESSGTCTIVWSLDGDTGVNCVALGVPFLPSSGTNLNAEDVKSDGSSVTEPILQPIRWTQAGEVKSQTASIPATLNKIALIQPENVLSQGSVGAGQVTQVQTFDINAGDVVSGSLVTAPTIDDFTYIKPTNVSSGSKVCYTPPVGATAVNADDVSSGSLVTEPTITPIRHIQPGAVKSQTASIPATLNKIADITSDDVKSQASISEPAVNFTWTIDPLAIFDDVFGRSLVTSPTELLQVLRHVGAAKVPCGSKVEYGSGYPVSYLLAVIRYISGDITPSQSIVTEPTLNRVRWIQPENVSSGSIVTAGDVEVKGKVEVGADDVISGSLVTEPQLDKIAFIQPGEVKSASLVTEPTPTVIWDITPSEVKSGSLVTEPTVTSAFDITADDVKSGSLVTEAQLTKIALIQSDDVSSQSKVESQPLAKTQTIQPENILSGSLVTEPSVELPGDINAEDLLSQSIVSEAQLTKIALIQPDDVKSSSIVSEPSVGLLQDITPEDIKSQSVVSEPSVTVESKDINAGNVISGSSVSSATLTAIRDITAGDVACNTSVTPAQLNKIAYILGGDVKSQSEIANQTLTIFSINPLYNFTAKTRAFNFNAENRVFNFNARNIYTDFTARTGTDG